MKTDFKREHTLRAIETLSNNFQKIVNHHQHTAAWNEKTKYCDRGEYATDEQIRQALVKLTLETEKVLSGDFSSVDAICYNSEFGDDRVCECGHSYYRHFDWAEEYRCSCKYCGCFEFKEKE